MIVDRWANGESCLSCSNPGCYVLCSVGRHHIAGRVRGKLDRTSLCSYGLHID